MIGSASLGSLFLACYLTRDLEETLPPRLRPSRCPSLYLLYFVYLHWWPVLQGFPLVLTRPRVRLPISTLNFWLITAAQERTLGPTSIACHVSRSKPCSRSSFYLEFVAVHYKMGRSTIIFYPYHPKSDELLTIGVVHRPEDRGGLSP